MAKDSGNPTILKLVLQGLISKWTPDLDALSRDQSDPIQPIIPPPSHPQDQPNMDNPATKQSIPRQRVSVLQLALYNEGWFAFVLWIYITNLNENHNNYMVHGRPLMFLRPRGAEYSCMFI